MTFLYENINALRQYNHIAPIPNYISANLNPNFELRPYQIQAFENFITHFECPNRPNPLQVLFHMATGSGKTLIMAGLMLYLYKQGYRNFLFFVNLTNIVEKTKDNFLNASSSKYLFASDIVLDGECIRINQVSNFQQSDHDAINICFTTTQGLHTDMWMTKENGMSYDDFESQEVVLLSDEAHHLNVLTKKKQSSAEISDIHTWEQTVNRILNKNSCNILLEFTATCNLDNPYIKSAYEDKIIFEYTLTKFYDDKYSKDIETFISSSDAMIRVLQALIISQYRLKVFQNNRLSIKPIILFKSRNIKECEEFYSRFISMVQSITHDKLRSISENCSGMDVLSRAFRFFADREITFENLASELKDEFSAEHCLSVNNDDDVENMQIVLNSLDNSSNPYRAIFEVRKLDEGWDVLNLFDIVRLYDAHNAADTTSEAQLIGRGARYCPFQIDNEQTKFQRKYDQDVLNELRVCETLYYHCQNDTAYISELKKSLREIGLDIDKKVRVTYKLKQGFKETEFYKRGKVFSNTRVEVSRNTVNELKPEIRDYMYSFRVQSNYSHSEQLMNDRALTITAEELKTTQLSVKEIANINYAIVNKALMKYPIFCFNVLKSYFPNVHSTRQFITDCKYLGGVRISIQSSEPTLSVKSMYRAVLYVLNKIASALSQTGKTYHGTKEFNEHKVRDIFKDKVVNYTDPHGDGVGIPQSKSSTYRIDLLSEDWFVYEDNYGTSEEKAFVCYFKSYIEQLKEKYTNIYLIRNEREFKIYSFDNGERFEPDYVLVLQNTKTDCLEQFQIFIEPKGEHLLEKDAWKEQLLLRLRNDSIPTTTFVDNNQYKIWGFHFFNQNKRMSEFRSDIERLINL